MTTSVGIFCICSSFFTSPRVRGYAPQARWAVLNLGKSISVDDLLARSSFIVTNPDLDVVAFSSTVMILFRSLGVRVGLFVCVPRKER